MSILQSENNIVPYPNYQNQTHRNEHEEHLLHSEDTDKKLAEMAKEAYLMRREIAIIAGIFFLTLIAIIMFAIGSMTQVNLPV